MANENLPKPTTALVPTVYYDIFTYKLMGLSYEQISEKTGYTRQWIKELFAKGGRLYELWQQWLKTAKEESVDEAITMMFGQLPDVVRSMIMTAKTPYTATGVMAGTKIMEYTIGKAQENINIRGAIVHGTFADWMKAQTLKEKQDEQNKPARLAAESG